MISVYPHGCKVRKGGWSAATEKRTHWLPGSKRDLFGIHLLDPDYRGDVFLCEGETDAMALDQHLNGNAPVVALAGEPSSELWGEWLAMLRTHCIDHTLYLCFDNDSKGEHYTNYVCTHYRQRKMGIVWGDSDYKDVAEALMGGYVPQWEPLPKLPPTMLGGQRLVERLNPTPLIQRGLSTGFEVLDRLWGTYFPGSMYLLAGGAKNGKSSFVAELAQRFINLHHLPVLFVPLEMRVEDTLPIIAASSLGVRLNDSDTDLINAECQRLSSWLYMLDHFGEWVIEDMVATLTAAASVGVKLVILDHITAACTSSVYGLQTQMMDAFLYQMKATLNELGLSAIVVSHINGNDNDRATLASLRGSRALGQVPEAVGGVLYVDQGMTEFYVVLPNRYLGNRGSVMYEYEGNRFTELAPLKSTAERLL